MVRGWRPIGHMHLGRSIHWLCLVPGDTSTAHHAPELSDTFTEDPQPWAVAVTVAADQPGRAVNTEPAGQAGGRVGKRQASAASGVDLQADGIPDGVSLVAGIGNRNCVGPLQAARRAGAGAASGRRGPGLR